MKIIDNSCDNTLLSSLEQGIACEKVLIASAFFSESKFIISNIDKYKSLKMIVRLNHGTSIKDLKKVLELNNPKIEVRFFSSENFHPKFYICDEKIAFVGSSNLTTNGLTKNQEVNVLINEMEIIQKLKTLFFQYWEQAKEVTTSKLNLLESILSKNKSDLDNISQQIIDKIGKVSFKERYKNQNLSDFSGYMYFCVGEGKHRNWDDYIKYNFIAAGQKKKNTNYKYGEKLCKLKKGDKFFAYLKGRGYVGYGIVKENAVKIDDFKIKEFPEKKLYDLPLKQPNIKQNHDNDASEWIVAVEWVKIFTRREAKTCDNIFAARHVVCKISRKHTATLNFLLKEFEIE